MVGFEIVDTYRAYKLRERKVTSWLKETAAKFGFRGSSPKAPEENHHIRIGDIPAAVRLIVANGESIPENLRQLLVDVICQRKEASVFYKSNPSRNEDEAGGHAHYLSVLEEALRTFAGRRGRDDEAPSLSARTAAPGHSKSDVEFSNLFDLLGIEEAAAPRKAPAEEAAKSVEESSDDQGSQEIKVRPSAKMQKKGKSGKKNGKARRTNTAGAAVVQRNTPTNAELTMISSSTARDRGIDAEDEEDELYFMIYCFFKDFNYMREYIQERWCDYQDGTLSLSAASVAINTAFELLQRSEKELLSQIPIRSGLRDYQRMADLLFLERGLAHVDCDQKQAVFEENHGRMNDIIYEEAEFIGLPTYWVLKDWLKNSPPNKIPTLAQFLGTTPNYQARDSEGRMESNRQIIFEMLAECCLIKEMKRNNSDFILVAEDELTIGWTTMLATRKIPIWLIFATQIFCDIRNILETEVSRCHEELQRMGQRVDSIVNNYISFAEDFAIPPHSSLFTTIGENLVDRIYSENMGIPNHSLKDMPIFAGILCFADLWFFRFSLTMNELGLKNSNQWGSTIACAHIYNAVRNELPSFPQWLDMEALFLIHTLQRVFWRDNLPSTPAQYASTYERATGVGGMILQRQSGATSVMKPRKFEQRGIGPILGVSQEYWERLCFGRKVQLETLPDVEKVLNNIAENEMQHSLDGLRLLGSNSQPLASSLAELSQPATQALAIRTPAAPSSNRALTQQFQRTHALTNVQLLEVLCTRISQESYALNFDYFGLHERCMVMLQAVYKEFEKEIVEKDAELDWGCGELPIVPHWIFEMMKDDSVRGDVLQRLERVMAPMIREQGKHEVARVRDFVAGRVGGLYDGKKLM